MNSRDWGNANIIYGIHLPVHRSFGPETHQIPCPVLLDILGDHSHRWIRSKSWECRYGTQREVEYAGYWWVALGGNDNRPKQRTARGGSGLWERRSTSWSGEKGVSSALNLFTFWIGDGLMEWRTLRQVVRNPLDQTLLADFETRAPSYNYQQRPWWMETQDLWWEVCVLAGNRSDSAEVDVIDLPALHSRDSVN